MKKTIITLLALATLTACHHHDNPEKEIKADRTVLVYISGECSLYDFIDEELAEMKAGSMTIGDNNLLVYVDRGMSQELPWLARIDKGTITDSVSAYDMFKLTSDYYSSDPDMMERILRYAYDKYPAKNDDYGLVLWGHASGWLINSDSIAYTSMARRKAYGIDNGRNTNNDSGRWLNIPTMAKLLSKVPHLKFIFADCCNFMCLECAYELRNVTDYIIGSPAEIPGVGAPYETVVPAMFEKTTFYSSIIEKYYAQHADGYDVPLSAVKTSEMENFANATKVVLKTCASNISGTYPDMSGLIHYYYDWSKRQEFYDANDFILKYASAENYAAWKQAFDKAVVYKKMATKWMTNKGWDFYGDFTVTDSKYGGVSMFVPQYILSSTVNEDIKKMAWYYAAGYSDIGW